MKIIVYFILCSCFLLSCTGNRKFKDALTHAQRLMEENPDSSLAILDTLGRHSCDFGGHFRMQYLLSLTYAQAKTGIRFETDSITKLLVRHFDSNGTCAEKALAYYLNGCALSDIGQAPEALQAFYDAIDKADTTSADCNYHVLKGIYGQMSVIFHRQNLPQDEIWALKHYIEYVRRTSSEEDYLIAKGQMVRPYYLMGEKDSVLITIADNYQSLRRVGKHKEAVTFLGIAMHIYIQRGQLDKARRAFELFEGESGLFDDYGNIEKGREGYYLTKGKYELALNHIDSAENYYRKAIRYGYLSDGYKGLLRIYRHRNVLDSVLLYSELYEAAQDSLHQKMQTDAIHQMASLYNYTRSQKEAEAARDAARKNRAWAISIALTAIMTIGIIFYSHRNNTRKRQQKIAELEHDLFEAMNTRKDILDELQRLKSQDYDGVIASKERQLAELTETINQLRIENDALHENSALRSANHMEHFLNSPIANQFHRKATSKIEKEVPSESEWKMLIAEFRKDNPATYKTFVSGKSLSTMELRICILLLLDIPEKSISSMINSSPSTVSNLKARANEKLFDKKDARPLKFNLLHTLKSV